MTLRSGEEGIRTPDPLSGKHAFQACALNHSATSPNCLNAFIHTAKRAPKYKKMYSALKVNT